MVKPRAPVVLWFSHVIILSHCRAQRENVSNFWRTMIGTFRSSSHSERFPLGGWICAVICFSSGWSWLQQRHYYHHPPLPLLLLLPPPPPPPHNHHHHHRHRRHHLHCRIILILIIMVILIIINKEIERNGEWVCMDECWLENVYMSSGSMIKWVDLRVP